MQSSNRSLLLRAETHTFFNARHTGEDPHGAQGVGDFLSTVKPFVVHGRG